MTNSMRSFHVQSETFFEQTSASKREALIADNYRFEFSSPGEDDPDVDIDWKLFAVKTCARRRKRGSAAANAPACPISAHSWTRSPNSAWPQLVSS
jgi:hypothetical protein